MFAKLKAAVLMFFAFAFSVFTSAAHAVIDVSAATTGISDASVAILAVIAALMTLATTVYGIMMVYRFVSKKSGVS